MKVEIWSDVVCPWCYIGKRRFETALARFDGLPPGETVEVSYHAYQLDPTAPPGSAQPVSEVYARKFGGPEQAAKIIADVTNVAAEDGITFHLDQAQRANTLLAHRVIWFAGHRADTDGDADAAMQAAVKERLMAGYFTDGVNVGDPAVLAVLAASAGMDCDEVAAFLATDEGHAEVMQDIAQAAAYGITAVPTYVVNGLWSIPGAQDPDTFVSVLTRMAERARTT